jgi:hypothetical protein
MGEYIAGGMSVVGGAYNMIQGAKQRRDARKALENYERQELKNTAENLQVSTLGADRRREEQARLAGTQIDALKGAGTRGIIGGLGRVEAGNQNVNADIAANLDEQQKQIDQMKAQEDANIRAMQENRENADISALSSQYNAGNESFQQGIGQTIGGVGAIANKYANREKPTTDNTTGVNGSEKVANNLSTGFGSKRTRRDVMGFDYYNTYI